MGLLTKTVNRPAERSLFSFIRRDSDGRYWHPGNVQFDVLDLATANEATRAPFRVAFTDNDDTSYDWTIDVSDWTDGTYTYNSYELSGVIEYGPFDTTSTVLDNGVSVAFQLEAELAYATEKTLFTYIKRQETGKYWRSATNDFAEFDIVSDAEATRETFRVYFAEGVPEAYSWAINLINFVDGIYVLESREKIGVLETEAVEQYTVLIDENQVVVGVGLGDVAVNHDSGGAADNLQYVTAGGDPIPGATIRCFKKADYDAGRLTLVQAITYTDSKGRWAVPAFLPTGNTYTVVFDKTGEYGPDAQEVLV